MLGCHLKEDFEPLLGPGRHKLSVEELRSLCVAPGCDTRRFDVYAALYGLLKRLEGLGVACEAWVDGSFVTQKGAPDDVDVSIMIESLVYDNLSPKAKEFVRDLSALDGKYAVYVDAFVCVVHPKGSVERTIDPPEDYAKQWSLEHNERHLKGFVVLEVQGGVR